MKELTNCALKFAARVTYKVRFRQLFPYHVNCVFTCLLFSFLSLILDKDAVNVSPELRNVLTEMDLLCLLYFVYPNKHSLLGIN